VSKEGTSIAQKEHPSKTNILKRVLLLVVVAALATSLFLLNAFFTATSLFGDEVEEGTIEVLDDTSDNTTDAATDELDDTVEEDGLEATVTISETDVPLIPYAAWALVNLVLSALGFILAIFTLGVFLVRSSKENDGGTEEKHNRRSTWPIISFALAVIAIIIFIATQDMNLSMGYMDGWTIPHALIFIAQIILSILALQRTSTNRGADGYAYNQSNQ